MSFDEDFKFDVLRTDSRQGRRGSKKNGDESEPFVITKKQGGWADEAPKSGKSSSKSVSSTELKRIQSERHDSDDDIPVIPDIDDLPSEHFNLPDLKISNISVKKATYKEIHKDNKLENLKKSDEAFGNIGEIDLTLLTSKLYPEAEVKSVDETWSLNSLALDLSNTYINTK